MRRKSGLVAVLAMIGVAGCASGEYRKFEARWKNKPAADFELAAVDGGKVKLSDYRGKPVVLAFWALGCPPCRAEAPHLSALADRHRADGLVVVGVNAWDEAKEDVARFVNEQSLKHRILLNGSGVMQAYGIDSIPVVFWIDGQGVVQDFELGFDGPDELRHRTERLLAKNR
jgi:thiol-disulfide isomerase/thioredoxin